MFCLILRDFVWFLKILFDFPSPPPLRQTVGMHDFLKILYVFFVVRGVESSPDGRHAADPDAPHAAADGRNASNATAE